jgi:hypothetical protein
VIGEPADTLDYFDNALPVIRVAGGGAAPGQPTLTARATRSIRWNSRSG